MANEKLRGYRRGIPYRNGDVKQEEFLKEFKFKGVEYGEGYSEKDKKRYLNYTYDALNQEYVEYDPASNPKDWEQNSKTDVSKVELNQLYDDTITYYTDAVSTDPKYVY